MVLKGSPSMARLSSLRGAEARASEGKRAGRGAGRDNQWLERSLAVGNGGRIHRWSIEALLTAVSAIELASVMMSERMAGSRRLRVSRVMPRSTMLEIIPASAPEFHISEMGGREMGVDTDMSSWKNVICWRSGRC